MKNENILKSLDNKIKIAKIEYENAIKLTNGLDTNLILNCKNRITNLIICRLNILNN